MDYYVYCPECGCEDVIMYDDGKCECQGCGFAIKATLSIIG